MWGEHSSRLSVFIVSHCVATCTTLLIVCSELTILTLTLDSCHHSRICTIFACKVYNLIVMHINFNTTMASVLIGEAGLVLLHESMALSTDLFPS